MVAIWVILGLIVATVSVSVLGASFSVIGLAALFSGAAVAVIVMASSLEFAKFVLSAYLHQRWQHLNGFFKFYLLFAIVTLSVITSLGIFGFLSDAYQSAATTLDAENMKIESLKKKQDRNKAEIERLNKNIEEIPVERISRRLKARTEAEPIINMLTKEIEQLDQQISESNLKTMAVRQKIGPLIYIARVFKVEIDMVVKYLILLLVFVFDPLAICMVIATSDAIESRKNAKREEALKAAAVAAAAPPVVPPPLAITPEVPVASPPPAMSPVEMAPAPAPLVAQPAPVVAEPAVTPAEAQPLVLDSTAVIAAEPTPAPEAMPAPEAAPVVEVAPTDSVEVAAVPEVVSAPETPASILNSNPMSSDHPSEEILQMRFADDSETDSETGRKSV